MLLNSQFLEGFRRQLKTAPWPAPSGGGAMDALPAKGGFADRALSEADRILHHIVVEESAERTKARPNTLEGAKAECFEIVRHIGHV